MDIALKKWIHSLRVTLEKIKGFDKNDTYYYMPRTSLYIRGFTKLKHYMSITREKRTGSYKVIRDFVILFEYLDFKVATLFKFARRKIVLPANENYFAVFIGNHRIRLSSTLFDSDLVIDLTEPKPNFNKSSARVLDSCFSNFAPQQKLIDRDCRVLSEERLFGIAINRLSAKVISGPEQEFLLSFRASSLKGLEQVSIDAYVEMLHSHILNASGMRHLNEMVSNIELDAFKSLVSNLINSLSLLKIDVVPMTPSHRDLNRGNVLACDGHKLQIIDWEFFGTSYWNYDIFIFLSNYRHSQNFTTSWYEYKENAVLYGIDVEEYDIVFFALEEAVFFIDNYSVREWKNIRDFKVVVEALKNANTIMGVA